MKIKPAPFKMIKVIVITGLMCLVLTLIPGIIAGVKNGFKVGDFIASFAVLAASIIYSGAIFFRTYYVLDEKYLIQQFLIKRKYFAFNRIAYIDDLRSRKLKSLVLYMDNGKQEIMVMDKNGKLLYEVQARAVNKLSRVEFLEKYPGVHLN